MGLNLLALLLGCSAQASGPISVNLCDSKRVLIGEVVSVTGYHHTLDGRQTLLSDVRLEPTHRIHGEVPDELLLTYEGGRVGDSGLSVSTSPTMRVGQSWLLFLGQSERWPTPFILEDRRFGPDAVLPGESALRRLWESGCGRDR